MSAYIYPNRGAEESVARSLLGHAHSPYHVRTNTDSGLAFVVEDYVADAYEAEQAAASDPTPTTEAPAAPRKRTPRASKKEEAS